MMKTKRKAAHYPKMDQDFFTYLPPEIILNILLRLSARSIMSCKCVCKPWFDLIATPEFVKYHLSKSDPGLVVFNPKMHPKPFKFVEFEEEHRWKIAFDFDLPFHEPMHSSANGLLLCKKSYDMFVCNPVTREYIKLPSPRQSSSIPRFQIEIYGFGVSRMSGQYKVVRMSLKGDKCQVYTIGTGSWRIIASSSPLVYDKDKPGAFLNGNLHWFAYKSTPKGALRQISCLDLETELFSTFSPPHDLHDHVKYRNLSTLGDCLCVCDIAKCALTSAYKVNIWLMKEYGDEKSWIKQFIIRKVNVKGFFGYLCPIKVFKDGDILMVLRGTELLYYYSNYAKTIDEAHLFELKRNMFTNTTIFAPSFLSLETFAMENVTSF